MSHWARVKEEAARMLAEVPLYAERGPAPPPPAADDEPSVSAWLASLPTVTKRDLRRGFPKKLVRRGQDLNAALAAGAVEIVSTSGTGDERTQVIRDGAWASENLWASLGGHEPFRHATLVPPPKGSACHSGNLTRAEREAGGVLTLAQLADPAHFTDGDLDRILDEWRDFGAGSLVANPAYLAPVARRARAAGRPLRAINVWLADELATHAERRAIAAGVEGRLLGLYRLVDAGVLFSGFACGRLHASARAHVELAPVGGGLARVIVTSLGRAWFPLLRYDTGDLVRLADGACDHPTMAGPAIARFEGRAADCVESERGLVTPAMIDDAVAALDDWQLLLGPSGPELIAVGDAAARDAALAAVSSLLGREVRASGHAIAPEASGKFRRVKKVEF